MSKVTETNLCALYSRRTFRFENITMWILIEEKSIRLDVDRFESLSLFGGWGFKSVLLS